MSFEQGSVAELWTMPQVGVVAGVEYRTLHAWVQRGLVTPSYPADGTGHPARFTGDELRHVCLLGRLRRVGCGLAILERAADIDDIGYFSLGEDISIRVAP